MLRRRVARGQELADGRLDTRGMPLPKWCAGTCDRHAGNVGEPIAHRGAVVGAGDADDADRREPAHALDEVVRVDGGRAPVERVTE
jgi:hypothetical protein